jgi:U4/U6 small nuclear ribonucleoprotein PRP31
VLGKASICARVDQFSSNDSSSILGQTGLKLREEIIESLRKVNEPPPARAIKPLPIPQDLVPKKTRRGGARARRFKEKYALTETQKQANRIEFSVSKSSGGEYLDGLEDGVDRGMIGSEMGGGRIRKQQAKKQKISKPNQSSNLTHGIEIPAAPSSTTTSIREDIFSLGFFKN